MRPPRRRCLGRPAAVAPTRVAIGKKPASSASSTNPPPSCATLAVANSSAAKPGPTTPVRKLPRRIRRPMAARRPRRRPALSPASSTWRRAARWSVQRARGASRDRRPVAWTAGTRPARRRQPRPRPRRREACGTTRRTSSRTAGRRGCSAGARPPRRHDAQDQQGDTGGRGRQHDASMNNCQTIRARLPPRAWRAANSCRRVTVRA